MLTKAGLHNTLVKFYLGLTPKYRNKSIRFVFLLGLRMISQNKFNGSSFT